jgi:peptidyl-prolyl cis-trans isomerase B (cyclophilin B)
MSRNGLRLVTAIAATLVGGLSSVGAEAQTRPAKPAVPRPVSGAPAAKAPAPANPAAKPAEAAVVAGTVAVVDTAKGSFTIRLLPEVAPEHAKHFVKTAKAGGYDGTTFHRIIAGGIIQGGDPLSKDPAKAAQYGTGGLGLLKAEFSDRPFVRGTVAAARKPSSKDSGGSQFFVVVNDQPSLLGQYTIFGEVVSGMEVVDQISLTPVDGDKPRERVEMKVTISTPVAP